MRFNAQLALDYAREHPDWRERQIVVDAIAKRVEQVAELAKYQFPRELRDRFPEIEWNNITGMRDRLVHDYDQLDLDVLRAVIDEHLPRLIATIGRLL